MAGAAWPDEGLTPDVSVAPLPIVPEEVQRQLLDSKGEALQRLIKVCSHRGAGPGAAAVCPSSYRTIVQQLLLHG